MGNYCARAEIDDSVISPKSYIANDYEEYPNKIVGNGVKATPAWQATITRAALNQKREEFWKTRSGGKRKVWVAIKAAVETDPGTAISIILNQRLVLKNGNLINIEDSEGNLYCIPIYMINDPLSFFKEKKHEFRKINTDDEIINLKIRRNGIEIDEEIKILNSHTVEDVKKKYCKKKNLDSNQMRLFFGGKEIKNHSTLASLFIENNMVIQVFHKGTLWK